MSDRVLLVVNPAAGSGRTGHVFDDLRRPIERALGAVDVEFTRAPGHASAIAREAATAGRRRIVAVGGDGTFSEVAAGVLESRVPSAVGLIHQGTGGDFRRSLGLEHRLDRYLEAIARDAPEPLDAGLVRHRARDGAMRERFFVNALSVGMGGLVDRYVEESKLGLSGTAAYLTASLEALAKGAAGRLTCQVVEGGEERVERLETRLLAVCNGRYFGGGMRIAPTAELCDGAFDVIALTGAARLPLLRAMASVYRGEHLELAGVRHFRASELSMELLGDAEQERFLLDVDGEWAGALPVTVRVLPRALRVLR